MKRLCFLLSGIVAGAVACGSDDRDNAPRNEPECVPAEPGVGGYGWDRYEPISPAQHEEWATECAQRNCMGRETALCLGRSRNLDYYGDQLFAMVRPEDNEGGRMRWTVWNEYEPGKGELCEIDAEDLMAPEIRCFTWADSSAETRR